MAQNARPTTAGLAKRKPTTVGAIFLNYSIDYKSIAYAILNQLAQAEL
jgi:hypothetical protein